MKKFFTLFIALVASIGIMFASVTIDGIAYNLNETELTAEVTSGGNYSGSIVIPESVIHDAKTYSVTRIGSRAFVNCRDLISITIPNSVTSISNAFIGCSGLTSVTIGNSVTNIELSAFKGCVNLTSIEIPNSVTSIGDGAFSGCRSLTSIEIPNSVTSIGWSAFENCTGLTSVTTGNGVTCIENKTFHGCSSLTSVNIGNKVTDIKLYAFQGCGNLTSISIPNSVTSIGGDAFSDCTGLTSMTIGNSVTSIGQSAFSNCNNLTSVIWNAKDCNGYNFGKQVESFVFGDEVEVIPDGLCSGMNKLTSIIIPNSVTSIRKEAFKNCSNLTSIEIPKSVTTIENHAFEGCIGFTSIEIPNSVTSIGGEVFNGCNITSVVWNAKKCNAYNFGNQVESFVFGDEVEVIPDGLCSGMNKLTSIIIPNSVTSIRKEAFKNCSNLTSIEIPNSVTNIGENAFNGCSGLTSVIIGDSVTSIEDGAFSGCSSLKSVTIPNSVTNIGAKAFQGCSNMTSVTIGNNVTTIGDWAFDDCSIDEIHFIGTTEEWCKKSWGVNQLSSSYTLYIGEEKLSNLVIPNSITSIDAGLISGCTNLTSIKIPNSVTSIAKQAFLNCTGLTSVTFNMNATLMNTYSSSADIKSLFGTQVTNYNVIIGNDVESIPYRFFQNLSSLTSVTIGNSVTSIGESAFDDCSIDEIHFIGTTEEWCKKSWGVNQLSSSYTLYIGEEKLSNLVIPNSVTSIGVGLISGCSNLISVEIPNSVTSIGEWAFKGCSGLTSVTIPNSVTKIGASAFEGCASLTSVTIPNSVTEIGTSAFEGCDSLTSVTIPNSVTNIGDKAFQDCSSLTSVTLNSNDIVSKSYHLYMDNISNIFGEQVKEYIIGEGVTSIGEAAFYECSSLTSIEIPNSVTSIGNYAFRNCSGLTSVTIGNSVTSIGREAFFGCTGLTSVTIGNSVTSIAEWAFHGCTSLTSVTIPNSVTSIGWDAFKGCTGLTSPVYNAHVFAYMPTSYNGAYIIPDGIETIAGGAFSGCSSLTSIEIPNSVTSIGDYAFANCNGLTSVNIPNSVTSIGGYAFANCNGLTSVNIPNSVTSIGGYAFKGCTGLTSAIIGNGVTYIGWYAFFGCTGLIFIEIPNSVTSIGKYAFSGCTGLTSITCESLTPPKLEGIVFAGDCSQVTLKVHASCIKEYKAADGWKDFTIKAIEGDYCITFLDWDGTKLKIDYVDEGKSATAPEDPTRKGYTFVGWDTDFSNVQSDLTVTAQYKKLISVTFVDWDGTVLKSEQVKEGDSATAPEAPTREGYTFVGWDTDFSNVQFDLTVTAQYTKNKVYYTVVFDDWDGTVLKTEQVEKGHSATAPPIPTREGYTFIGWDKNFSNVQSNLTVTAQYTKNKYTVTFVDWDGKVLKTEQVEEGQSATAPANPTREGSTFTGWDTDFSIVQSDLVVTAQYKVTYYTLKFNYYDKTDGDSSSAIKELAGLFDEASMAYINADAEFLIEKVYLGRIYTEGVKKIHSNLKFGTASAAGKLTFALKDMNVEKIVFRAAKYGDNDGDEGFSVNGVSFPLSAGNKVFENVIYTPKSAISAIEIVQNKEANGRFYLTSITVYPKGSGNVTPPEALTNISPANSGKVDVVYQNEQHTSATLTAIPNTGYHFVQWSDGNTDNPRIISLTQDTTFTALFVKNMYLVQFLGFNEVLLSSQEVEHGTAAVAPEPPIVEHYEFVGWDKDFSHVISDMVITAQYQHTGPTADKTETTDVTVTIAEDGSVILEWPEVEGADTYTIEISKNGELVCTLIFNSQGQLLSMRFALVARDGSSQTKAASQTNGGWQYVVTGLEPGAEYSYTMTAKRSDDTILFTKTISFTMEESQDIDLVQTSTPSVQKVMIDGQVLIQRGDKLYTLTGQEVK